MELMKQDLINKMVDLFEKDANDADLLTEDVGNLIEMGFTTETVAALVALVYGLKAENTMLEGMIELLEDSMEMLN